MQEIKCPRCSGLGRIEKYNHVEMGICFECSGKGTLTQEEYNRYEEDIAKQAKKAIKRAETSKQVLLDSLKKQWFNNADIIYIVNESNTYSIKNQLKEAGAIYNNNHRVWYFKEVNNNYQLFSIQWKEVLNDNDKGYSVNLQQIIKTRSNGILKGY
jgi:polyhydroxyalkanoate synthesis regulator phasin